MSLVSWLKKSKRLMGPVLSVGLFGLAAVALHHELKLVHFHEVLHALKNISHLRVAVALLFTLASYGALTCYDVLASRYVGADLSYRQIGLASFVGYAFSNNIGLSMIAGASVRYRLYSAWGVSAEAITKIVLFCSLSLWLGFLALGGFVFAVFPFDFSRIVHVPLGSSRILGGVMLAVVLVYGIGVRVKKTPFRIKGWEFASPSLRLTGLQLGVAVLDWLLAAFVLYTLLAAFDPIPFSQFIAFYLMAQLLGIVSQVPGGLGVFETTLVLLLSSLHPAPQVFAALLLFRGIYYWVPLILSVLFLGGYELAEHRAVSIRMGKLLGKWISPLLPNLLGVAAMVGGMILLFSGATPSAGHRMRMVELLIPLPLVELSHFIGSLTGMGLILLGRSLQRRVDAAWAMTILLLAFGAVASIVKGLDYEEAALLTAIGLGMLPARHQFYRKASLFSERLNAGWIAAILVVIGASVWFGFFSYRHVDYSHDLWWQFSYSGDAPRFLRASVGAVGLALLFSVGHLLRPGPPPRGLSEGSSEEVDAIVRQSPNATANLAYLGDKRFLFSPGRDAFIMYGVAGESWIAMGDPVGPERAWAELIPAFRRAAHRFGDRSVFYEVNHSHLHLYLDAGLTLLKLGEAARVPLPDFSLDSRRRKDLRYIHRKIENQNCSFEILPPEAVGSHIPVLEEISHAWLREKNTREKGFSLGSFIPDYLSRFPMAVVRQEGRIVAFANIWTSAGGEELSVDLMRHLPDAPRGIMDFLFIEMMLWGRREGYRWFDLGMAPLSGMDARQAAPLWHKISGFVAAFGGHFYNFQGIRLYKQKFDPEWSPKYMACPGGLLLPRILTDVASLVSGGIKGIVMK